LAEKAEDLGKHKRERDKGRGRCEEHGHDILEACAASEMIDRLSLGTGPTMRGRYGGRLENFQGAPGEYI
jgi:hypothetical protein